MKRVALIPAYNAGRTIAEVIERLPASWVDEVVVVDDGSRDDTAAVLRALPGIEVLHHPKNLGYGAAQITLYRAALERDADAIVILHADGGHRPEEIPAVLGPILDGSADVVTGSRTRGILAQSEPLLGSRTLRAVLFGPMPGYKLVANLLLSRLQNFCYGTRFSSFHSGFRACSAAALRAVPFDQLTRWYLYDTEFFLAAREIGLRVREVPVSAFYDHRAGSSAPSIRYGLRVVRHALGYRWGKLSRR